MKIKSKGVFHNLMEALTVQTWERTNADGAIPVQSVRILRWGSFAVLSVSAPVTKAMTANSSNWIGTTNGEFIPGVDIAKWPVNDGYVTFRANTDGSKADINFIPSRNLSTMDYVYIMIPYLCKVVGGGG